MALVGCGDDDGGGGGADAAPADAGSTADAKSADANPSAPTHAGTIGVHEISLIDSAAAGRGIQINASFSKLGTPTVASFSNNSFPPCTATLTDVTVAAQNPAPLNEGAITVAVSKAGGGAGFALPPCAADATGTYRCVSKQGTGGTLAATANPQVFKFTDTTATPNTFSSLQVGHYLIEVATKKAFPIVGQSGSTLAIQAGTGAAAGSIGAWIAAAGVGPIALLADPDGGNVNPVTADTFFANTDTVKVSLATATGSGNDFTYQTTGTIDVGDDFELDTATSQLLLDKINLNTTAGISFACNTTGAKACSITNAQGIIVVIDSTDATSFPGGLTDMGTPVKYVGNITCAALANTTVTVPKEAFAVLKQGNPTKLRISFFRDAFEPLVNTGSGPKNSINVVAGHGLIKFQVQ